MTTWGVCIYCGAVIRPSGMFFKGRPAWEEPDGFVRTVCTARRGSEPLNHEPEVLIPLADLERSLR